MDTWIARVAVCLHMERWIARMAVRRNPAMLEQVLDRYAQREIGLGRAAHELGIQRVDFQHMAGQRGIDLDQTVDDLQRDMETLAYLDRMRDGDSAAPTTSVHE